MTGPNKAEFAAVPPGDVATYLTGRGWRRDGSEGLSEIWSLDELDVLLPENSLLRDYPVRLAELVSTLADVEGRPREEVLRDLRSPRVDVQHIRLLPDSPSGTTPLHEGFVAIRGVHDLFLAAATSAILRSPTPVLPNQKPSGAWSFMRGVRLGQTGVGSYVLRVETPIVDSISAGDSLLSDPVSSREVLTRLHRGVQAAHSAANANQVSAFERYTQTGVSANFCKALADIGGVRRSPFEISFAWAPAEPRHDPMPALHFDRRMISRLKEASEHLRTLLVADNAQVVGRVVELRRASPNALGAAVIEGTVHVGNQRSRDKIIARLRVNDYETAMQLHRTGESLVVRGRLVRSGSHLELTDVEVADPER